MPANLYPVSLGTQWGYSDSQGRLAIPARFDRAIPSAKVWRVSRARAISRLTAGHGDRQPVPTTQGSMWPRDECAAILAEPYQSCALPAGAMPLPLLPKPSASA